MCVCDVYPTTEVDLNETKTHHGSAKRKCETGVGALHSDFKWMETTIKICVPLHGPM